MTAADLVLLRLRNLEREVEFYKSTEKGKLKGIITSLLEALEVAADALLPNVSNSTRSMAYRIIYTAIDTAKKEVN